MHPTRHLPWTFSLLLLLAAPMAPTGADATPRGIWISSEEVSTLPTEGEAWEALLDRASQSTDTPDLSDQDDPTNVRVLAKALVYARTGQERYRSEVIDACMAAIGTEASGEILALGRELAAYVISADLVGLPSAEDQAFRAWLRAVRVKDMGGRTLISHHEARPNNHGTHAGASRAAVAVYLGDDEDLARIAQVFRGWLGDRTAYSGFRFGDLWWQADPEHPVGINPVGAVREGHSIDGVLPDDQRRGGSFEWPPPNENYVWEALQGVLATAVILSRAGYDVWSWEDRALLRAVRWLHEENDFPAVGDDTWQPHLVNFYYGTSFPAPVPSRPGKNLGFTDWTHGSRNPPAPRPPPASPPDPPLLLDPNR